MWEPCILAMATTWMPSNATRFPLDGNTCSSSSSVIMRIARPPHRRAMSEPVSPLLPLHCFRWPRVHGTLVRGCSAPLLTSSCRRSSQTTHSALLVGVRSRYLRHLLDTLFSDRARQARHCLVLSKTWSSPTNLSASLLLGQTHTPLPS